MTGIEIIVSLQRNTTCKNANWFAIPQTCVKNVFSILSAKRRVTRYLQHLRNANHVRHINMILSLVWYRHLDLKLEGNITGVQGVQGFLFWPCNDSEIVDRRSHIPQTSNSKSVHTRRTSVKEKTWVEWVERGTSRNLRKKCLNSVDLSPRTWPTSSYHIMNYAFIFFFCL